MAENGPKLNVLLTTEGTFPGARGGRSTWTEALLRGMPGVSYHVLAIQGNADAAAPIELPPGVAVTRLPAPRAEDRSDHLDFLLSPGATSRAEPAERLLCQEFLPRFTQLLETIFSPQRHGVRTGRLLADLHDFFQEYDYRATLTSRAVWEAYCEGLATGRWYRRSGAMPTLFETRQTLDWLCRLLVVLSAPLPRTDLVHASSAGFCAVPGVLARLRHRTPFLLSEQRVYLRQQYISVGRSTLSPFARTFLLGLVQAVVGAAYAYADLVAPASAFGARWAQRLGVPGERIRIIHGGVDPVRFSPLPRAAGSVPTVISVTRIHPARDVLTLLHAASLVRQQVPEAVFRVYGGVEAPGYYSRCLALREELGLTDSFSFAGQADDVAAAYAGADVVAIPGLSDGFPYAVAEAMACGRPVVAAAGGGVREVCGSAGFLVRPGDPDAMAGAITRVLRDRRLWHEAAQQGRERAVSQFSLQKSLEQYRRAYAELTGRKGAVPAAPPAAAPPPERELAIQRAMALEAAGLVHEAIAQYRRAVSLDPASPATPVILMRIAELYLEAGDVTRSLHEMERAEALLTALGAPKAA